MDRGGQFTEGELPDGMGDGPEDDPSPLRGWVPPDDRLWLHPSEVAKLGAPDDVVGGRPPTAPSLASAAGVPGQGRRSQAVAVSAAVVSIAVVLLVLIAERGPAQPGAPMPVGTTSLATALVPSAALTSVAARLDRSLVGLVVRRSSGTSSATGVAMAPGDLVVTSSSAVAHATSVTAVSSSGQRLRARLLGTDPTSGVAVLRVDGQLTPARFDDDVNAGQLAMTACVCDRIRDILAGNVVDTMALARVDAVGVQPSGGPGLLDTIEADRVRADDRGAVLTDSSGGVAGLLDTHGTGHGGSVDVFVPGWLAEDVATQLAQHRRVVHGWLGVTGVTESGGCGAQVQSVVPGAPAQSALTPGDVVLAVDGRQVCGWPELQASLYVMAPDQPVELEVAGPSGTTVVDVALSASPG